MLIDPNSPNGILLAGLRAEAAGVRGCFRDISVQAIGLAVSGTGAIFYAMSPERPAMPFGAIGMFLVLMATQRLGIHKFSTANRILGYQLHLERLGPDDKSLSGIGWEEAVRAWRIVQATLFSELYRTPKHPIMQLPFVTDLLGWRMFGPRSDYADEIEKLKRVIKNSKRGIQKSERDIEKSKRDLKKSERDIEKSDKEIERLKRVIEDSKRDIEKSEKEIEEAGRQRILAIVSITNEAGPLATHDFWWMQAERAAAGGGKYHAGSYLERMFGMLSAAQVLSLSPLVLATAGLADADTPRVWSIAALVVLIGLSAVWLLNWWSLRRRRCILEREFLSIHSCAIVWKAVVMAHDLAWNPPDADQRRRYTERLAHIAHNLSLDVRKVREHTDARHFPKQWASKLFASTDELPKPGKNRRKHPHITIDPAEDRAIIIEHKNREYPGTLVDVARSGCGIRFECVDAVTVENGEEVVLWAAEPGSPVADLLGGYRRGGTLCRHDKSGLEISAGIKFTDGPWLP